MPTFRCKVRTRNGLSSEKTLRASDKQSLRERLEREGYFVPEIRRLEESGALLRRGGPLKRVRTKELLVFNHEFSVLIKAGLPILNALNAIVEKGTRDELTKTLSEIRDDITAGASLSEAFRHYSHIFSDLYIATLQAGERSGNISVALSRYIDYAKKMLAIRQKVIAASVYPAILTTVSVFVLLFLLVYVVPSFVETYLQAGTRIPEITMMLVRTANIIKNNFAYLLCLAAAVWGGYRLLMKQEEGRIYLDKFKLQIPFLGAIYIYYSLSKLTRTLATVLRGGIPLLDSLRISSGTVDNHFLKLKLVDAANVLEKGEKFSESLAGTGVFPKLALRMVEAGESSGQLDQILDDVADFYESEVDTKLSILTSSIEPALMVIMGLLIGFIVVAMYMPIFQMAGTIG